MASGTGLPVGHASARAGLLSGLVRQPADPGEKPCVDVRAPVLMKGLHTRGCATGDRARPGGRGRVRPGLSCPGMASLDVPPASSPGRRRNMQAIKAKDTTPEVVVRSALHRMGFRFRKHQRPVPSLRCTADVVFTRQRVAVFINGCYWHGCADHSAVPRTNTGYWSAKISGNVERDARNNKALTDAGWLVLRFWEHEAPVDVVQAVARVLNQKR